MASWMWLLAAIWLALFLIRRRNLKRAGSSPPGLFTHRNTDSGSNL